MAVKHLPLAEPEHTDDQFDPVTRASTHILSSLVCRTLCNLERVLRHRAAVWLTEGRKRLK